jgi:hypothetical protein
VIRTSLVEINEEAPPLAGPPTALVKLAKAIEECFHDHLSPLEVLTFAIKTVLCC